MSPSERENYDRLYQQYRDLQEVCRTLRIEAGKGKAVKAKPSPRGHIDKRGATDSGKAGIAGGLVGAWSDDAMQHIEQGIDAAGGSVKFIYSFTMVEDVVGFCVGFFVLGLATACIKAMKTYG